MKEVVNLQKQMNESKPKATDTKYKSSTKLFENAPKMDKTEEKFRSSLVVCVLKSAICQYLTGVNTIKKESKVTDFYQYL